MNTPHAFRATAQLHAALAEADAAISAAGRDLRAEHKRALEATDIVLVMGHMGGTVLAAKYLITVTEGAIARLRMQLQRSMEETGAGTIAIGNGARVSMAREPIYLDIEEGAEPPERFKIQPPAKWDTKAVKQAIEAGEDVPHARLVRPNEQRLIIAPSRKDAA